MIRLNRLNGQPVVINADLIEMLEVTPEVVILLTTGKRIVVRQNVDEIVQAVIDYQRSIGVKRPPPHLITSTALRERDNDG